MIRSEKLQNEVPAISQILFVPSIFEDFSCFVPGHLRLVILKPVGRILEISDSNPIPKESFKAIVKK